MSKMTKEEMDRGIVKVPVRKTTDGQIFESQEDAIEHQREIDFDTWYEENRKNQIVHPFDDDGQACPIYVDHIRHWLTENKAEILRFLGV